MSPLIWKKLFGLPIFYGLEQTEIEAFVTGTRSKFKQFAKHERILQAYAANYNIGVIVSGEAQVLSEDRFGHESIGHRLERGALVGTTSAILPQVPYNMAVEALTDVLILTVPYRSLLVTGPKLGHIHGIVMKNFLEAFCKKNVLMMQKIELLSQKSLRERLILYLLQRGNWQESERVHVPGRVQLAKELECNRSALTREIGLMKEKGLLLTGEDWMQLTDAVMQGGDEKWLR